MVGEMAYLKQQEHCGDRFFVPAVVVAAVVHPPLILLEERDHLLIRMNPQFAMVVWVPQRLLVAWLEVLMVETAPWRRRQENVDDDDVNLGYLYILYSTCNLFFGLCSS